MEVTPNKITITAENNYKVIIEDSSDGYWFKVDGVLRLCMAKDKSRILGYEISNIVQLGDLAQTFFIKPWQLFVIGCVLGSGVATMVHAVWRLL